MAIFHKELVASGQWLTLSLFEQLGNVASEVGRAHKWQGRDRVLYEGAMFRALELLDLTLDDPRLKAPQLKEIARAREVICDAFFGGQEYKSSLEDLDRYFFQFAFAARREK